MRFPCHAMQCVAQATDTPANRCMCCVPWLLFRLPIPHFDIPRMLLNLYAGDIGRLGRVFEPMKRVADMIT